LLFVGRKFFEGVDDRWMHRCKMALVAREDCEVMPMGGRSDCDIGKARRMTTAARRSAKAAAISAAGLAKGKPRSP